MEETHKVTYVKKQKQKNKETKKNLCTNHTLGKNITQTQF